MIQPVDMTQIDAAILEALECDQLSGVSYQPTGSSFSDVGKLTLASGAVYFVKCSRHKEMIHGELHSYKAINAVVPEFCPAVIASGVTSSGKHFLITEFLDFSKDTGRSLAQTLVRLHEASTEMGYGFYLDTCCADTVQDNRWCDSWTVFFIERRLRPIALLGDNADDQELQRLVNQATDTCVPRLLNALTIKPALIHGDLWSGNERNGRVFDSCALYAHTEFELCIMRMFGGFSAALKEYEHLQGLDEPVDERDDRIALYMCYHQLNHSGTGQGNSYRQSAKTTLRKLSSKYG